MKKIKLILWIIVVLFIGLVFFQNQEFFLEKKGININLYFAGEYPIELHQIVWFAIILIVGLLVAYFFGLAERFKLKKTIKELKAKIDTQIEMISQIRSELESRTGFSDEGNAPAPLDIVETVPEPSDVKVTSDD